ncbi:MAG: OFA family MFS transporter [Vicinamibacterales bacterium]|jgi:MFS family permease|nr:MFS transporter [Acidobacteriota bacterium]MDP6372315.1 OFA family MFS transporter [Vicinamibacterales bacterium]MDP6610638.1 OFA family MFS transporter [Vicinamibacterales bacterium]HAK55737.1 MFS transporter [Acidobacteriota bacterium]|tara:strand:- start:1112 stop:2575 length:1464 start_codon:yes stop_codon:yes gene_type:complete
MSAGLLSRERIVAGPRFNRWLIIPAVVAIEASIGQIYAFSIFNLPLTRAVGITQSTLDDWRLTTLGWVFTLAMVFLGLSAAFGGKWVEDVGPRKAGVVAAFCWGSGFYIAAVGVQTHQIWLLYLGYGVLGGCGLGIGYIAPVTTLVQWFPDRRGLATGLAIMGFGGGAIIAAPASEWMLTLFATESSVGVAETFVVLGTVYLAAMLVAAFMMRVSPPGWKPEGWTPVATGRMVTTRNVHPSEAIRTPQFYMLAGVLLLNVTAGIGVFSQASALFQEVFDEFSAASGAMFVGLLSFFNMAGRLFWASFSDKIGRKATFGLFLSVGPALYALVPVADDLGGMILFVGCFAVIITMYGGGFSTMPAYIADIFGTQYVGAIFGRVLIAHSCAAVLGPVLVNYLREFQLANGVPAAQSYNVTMYIMAGLLVLGFFVNRALTSVDDDRYLDDTSSEEQRSAAETATPAAGSAQRARTPLSDGPAVPDTTTPRS